MGGNLISHKFKKQPTISLSSVEVKYRALRNTIVEHTWVVSLLQYFGILGSFLVTIYYDNQAPLSIARNPIMHELTKHIELDCYFFREKLADGLRSLSYIHTSMPLDDIFTKPFPLALKIGSYCIS